MSSRLTVVLVSLLLATPVVIFWLWLVIVPARVAILCPEECKCNPVGYHVSCTNTSLTAVPIIPFTGVRELRLQHNNITLFERDSFVTLTELEGFIVERCGLTNIEWGAFSGLTKLTELYIFDNELSEIIPGTFVNMSNLDHLDLSYNRLYHLDSAVFSGLVNLKDIYLGGNELQYVNPDTFLGLRKLQNLYLSNNPVLHIPTDRNFINSHSSSHLDISHCNVSSVSLETFANVSALERLDVSYNRLYHLDSAVFSGLVNIKDIYLGENELQYVNPDTFLQLPNLQTLKLNNNPGLQTPTGSNFVNSHSLSYLDISHCNVSSVSVETFANVSALKWLDLSNNNLRTVDIKILIALPKLSELYLNGNPLKCDCQLQEVWRLCQHRNIQTGYGVTAPVCDTPSEVKGMWWGVLEKGQCLEGNLSFHANYNNATYRYTENKGRYKGKYDFEFLKRYEVPLYAVPFIFGTTGNIILLIIIICNKDMRTLPNMYILNLATSDIIYLTVLFTEACANKIYDTWLDDGFMCTFLPFCRRLSVGLSAYSVAVLSIQRYKVTVNPFHLRVSSPTTWRDIVGKICGVWIVAALFAVPSALSKYLCLSLSFLNPMHYYQHEVIFEVLVSCVLPLCVIAVTYIMTACHLVESSLSLFEGTQNALMNTRRNTANIVLGLTVVFMISYVPYHVLLVYIINNEKMSKYRLIRDENLLSREYEIQYPYLISTCLLLINSCLNPVALFCTSSPFRQHLRRYLTCYCKTNSTPADLELTRRN